MSDTIETIDILAKRVLAKVVLDDVQEVFQENYEAGVPLGTKAPLLLYIVNHGAINSEVPNTSFGSAVRCLKLVRRILTEDPRNVMVCSQKSKVIIDFELVLIVEYEDDTYDVLTLPKNLSSRLHYDALITKALVDDTVIDVNGVPVVQHQNLVKPYETLTMLTTDVNEYTNFEYTITIPLTSFDAVIRRCELTDPTLKSYILLCDLDYDVEVLDQHQVFTTSNDTMSIWTTMVDFSLFEDIIDKLAIDQDVQILGTPELVCCERD